MVHIKIESILCIVDVELSIGRSLAFSWNKRSSFVTEMALNLEHIGTTSMSVNLLVLIVSKRCHCQCIVIVLNMIMEFLGLIILTLKEMAKFRWWILQFGNLDFFLIAAHAKLWIYLARHHQFL